MVLCLGSDDVNRPLDGQPCSLFLEKANYCDWANYCDCLQAETFTVSGTRPAQAPVFTSLSEKGHIKSSSSSPGGKRSPEGSLPGYLGGDFSVKTKQSKTPRLAKYTSFQRPGIFLHSKVIFRNHREGE